MSYSNSSGGTLTLPSPTHVHHVDVTSAVRSLRRSLSRSPSKFRLVTKSPSSSPKSPLSPSPLSPPKRASSQTSIFAGFTGNPPHTPSPLAVPFPPSAKLALRSSTRAKGTPTRSSSRTRTSPKSPIKRALSQAADAGNATPSTSSGNVIGQENSRPDNLVPRRSLERISKMPFNLDAAPPVNQALSRLGGDGTGDPHTASNTSSPLKRSDAIMNLDQASLGSPVAKRRSLHGSANFGHDFNVFDHGPSATPQFDIHDDANHEYELSTASITTDSNSPFTNLPRRSSSLRKSTLQQRHGEKTSWGRRHAAALLLAQKEAAALAASASSNGPAEVSTPSKERNRPRLSLDQFMPPMPRDSPFSAQGSLPNASMHMMNQPTHQPHPLSRTMTTSSSNSSIVDESPTHVPTNFGEQPRPKLDFSKSLPAGSMRPFNFEVSHNDGESFATPQNYKSAKPLPAAFASTGLISKVNRHPEEPQRGLSKGNVPDTPCKKPFNGFATYPAQVPGSAIAKARHIRHSFGNPSTPFSLHGNTPVAATFGKPAGVFGSSFGNNGPTRRGSFLSIDGDEHGGSPEAKDGRQVSAEFELPPTPTKQALAQQQNDGSPSNHRSFPASQSAVGYSFAKHMRASSKLNISTSHTDQEGDDSDESMDMNDSPTTSHGRVLKPSTTVSSFVRPSTLQNLNLHAPAPTLVKSASVPISSSPSVQPRFAKFSHVASASPLRRIDLFESTTPRTPQESMVPPDPSGLTISNPRDANVSKSGGLSTSMPPPATPTTGKDYFPEISPRPLSTTPISTFAPPEIDDSLTSRFEKVEMIGSGEFSLVYRVTQKKPILNNQYFPANTSLRSPPIPLPERVFAVKKSRQPFLGTRDRQKKLQEVNVLKALGRSDHVVHLVDTWEEKSYLYIQTEFCEEGSLDIFLSQVGRKGRLDDFRIWKVMLEIALGLKHIHDSGYIHLDLKPANVLITFSGSLKIADFGMATSWPAQPGVDGEGDREYIGPEILQGNYDKPADVFALGLIMLEIAGNVLLPDNGPSWQKLRSGDLTDVPSLTWSSDSTVPRDITGIPIVGDDNDILMENCASDDDFEPGYESPTSRKRSLRGSGRSLSHDPGNLFGGSSRGGELQRAPPFMTNMYHEHALDKIVRWMISPNPQDRPIIHQVLEVESVRWVASRRRAAATVYEGNWGPADELLGDDAEMLDV